MASPKFHESPSQKPLVTPSPDDSGVNIAIEDAEVNSYFDDIQKLPDYSSLDFDNVVDVKIDVADLNSAGSSDSGNGSFFQSLSKLHTKFETAMNDNQGRIKKICLIVLGVAYLAYFVAALVVSVVHKCVDPTPLIVLTTIALVLIVFSFIRKRFGTDIVKTLSKLPSPDDRHLRILKWFAGVLVLGGIIAVVAVTLVERPRNGVSLAGLVSFFIILMLLSANPRKVNFRPVIGGFVLQFYFAVIILKWDIGYKAFHFLGGEVKQFLDYTDEGSKFVFGDKYLDHLFAMKVLPVIVFFSCFISTLYYLGVMQAIIGKIAFVMRISLGTTAAESLCAAGNIFVGQTEAPILVRPFLPVMTRSELHAVMVGGFATIAGGVLAAYVSFGVPAEHLLCASVMNAPCALAVSKILYPEVEHSRITKTKHINTDETKHQNILEAAAAGASSSIMLVANIAANLIAFLALLAFVNATLSWFGGFVCFPQLTFELICSYVFMPITYVMGVSWQDSGVVGELVGIKTFLNEFVAYKELAKYIKNREECILDKPILDVKSEIIATYALCGFSNLSSIGIQLGGLGPMAPTRAGDLAQLVVRALVGGIIACLITATIAGLLVVETPFDMVSTCAMLNKTDILSGLATNFTVNSTLPSIVNATAVYSL